MYRQSRKEVYRRSINKYSIFNPLIIVWSCIGLGRYCCLWAYRYGNPSRTKEFSDILLKGIRSISFYIDLYKTFLNRLTNFTILYQQHNHLIFRCNIFQYLWCLSLKSLFNDVWSPLFRLKPVVPFNDLFTTRITHTLFLNQMRYKIDLFELSCLNALIYFLIFASPYWYKNCSRSKVE